MKQQDKPMNWLYKVWKIMGFKYIKMSKIGFNVQSCLISGARAKGLDRTYEWQRS